MNDDITRSINVEVTGSTRDAISARRLQSSGTVHVRFDNFAAAEPPPSGSTIPIFANGWTFGRRSVVIWSLNAPAVVALTRFGIELAGFRTGRLRHLKFLLHDVGVNRTRFDRAVQPPRPGSMSLRAAHAALTDATCPALGAGERSCVATVGVEQCSAGVYWHLDAAIGERARAYEGRALDDLESEDVIGCIGVDPPKHGDGTDGAERRTIAILLANVKANYFVHAATIWEDPGRFHLSTAFSPSGGAVPYLLRRAEKLESIERICGKRADSGAHNQLQMLLLKKQLNRSALVRPAANAGDRS